MNETGREREGVSITEYVATLPPLDQVGGNVGGVTGEDEGVFRDVPHRQRMIRHCNWSVYEHEIAWLAWIT